VYLTGVYLTGVYLIGVPHERVGSRSFGTPWASSRTCH
jgi:hypothetical protein